MEIKNLMNRFSYLICGIIFVLIAFLVPVFYYHGDFGGTFETRIYSVLFYWWETHAASGTEATMSISDNLTTMVSLSIATIIIGAILLTLTSILYNKDKIRNILPPIAIGFMLFGLIIFSNFWFGPWVDEFSGVLPFYYYDSGSSTKTAFLSIGYYIGIGLAGTCGVKYFFFNDAN